jgi:hypothetical protein
VTLDKMEVVLLTLAFLVPGFIMHSVISLFTVRRNESTKEILFLRFLAFSTLNIIICLPLLYQVVARHWITTRPWLTAFCLFGITFVSPLVLGLAVAWLDQKQTLQHLAGRLGLHALHCTPSAWDFKFSQASTAGGRWIMVELKDSRKIGGWFGNNSFASSEPTERDLYLEEAWELPSDSADVAWNKRVNTDGILIRHDDIRTVSFIYDPAQFDPANIIESKTWTIRWEWIKAHLPSRSPKAIPNAVNAGAITNGCAPTPTETQPIQLEREQKDA